MTTPDIRPGTVLSLRSKDYAPKHVPRVSHVLYTVSRLTATQAIAVGERGEVRVRLKDLGVVGEAYYNAKIATDEILSRHAAEVAERKRWSAAHKATSDLIGKELHQLNLSTAQLEALAQAWIEIKAMK